jgi:hypothetical protein
MITDVSNAPSRAIISLFLLLCAAVFGVHQGYDNTPVRFHAGYGEAPAGITLETTTRSCIAYNQTVTWIDNSPVGLTGTIDTLKFTRYSTGPATSVHYFFASKSGSNYTIEVAKQDITTYWDRDGVDNDDADKDFLELTGLSHAVQRDWYFGMTLVAPATTWTGLYGTNNPAEGGDLYTHSFQIGEAASSSPFTLSGTSNPRLVNYALQGTTAEYVSEVYDNGASGFGNDSGVRVASFDDAPFYIVLRDVDCPSGEDLEIAICSAYEKYDDDAVGDSRVWQEYAVELDFTGSGTMKYMKGYPSQANYHTESQVLDTNYQAGDKFDIFIWVDPNAVVDTSAYFEVIYVNEEDGQSWAKYDLPNPITGGTKGATTVYSITNNRAASAVGQPLYVTGCSISDYNVRQTVTAVSSTTITTDLNSSAASGNPADGTIRMGDSSRQFIHSLGKTRSSQGFTNGGSTRTRYVYITQGTGTGANVGSIQLARKPIVTLGSSIGNGPVAYLEDAFTEERCVIRGSSGGAKHYPEPITSLSLYDRWNTWTDEVDPFGHPMGHDLCAFNDVVYIMVNGMVSVNDFNANFPGLYVGGEGENTLLSGEGFPEALCMKGLGIAQQMVGEVLSKQSVLSGYPIFTGTDRDVIMTMMAFTDNPNDVHGPITQAKAVQLITEVVNPELQSSANLYGVPYSDIYTDSITYVTDNDGVHLSNAGNEAWANDMASVYEGNTVPSAPGAGSGGSGGSGYKGIY